MIEHGEGPCQDQCAREATAGSCGSTPGPIPTPAKRMWRSATTKGTRRAAQRALVEFAARLDYPRRMTAQATVANFLDNWYAARSLNWSPTTARQTKSVIDRHLAPRLGHLKVATLRTEDIDALSPRCSEPTSST